MFKLWVIAHREYVAMVGTKAFLFTLVMMPILMFGSLLVMPVLNRVSGGKTQKLVISDGTGQLFSKLETAAKLRNEAIQSVSPKPTEAQKAKADAKPSFMDAQADIWELIAARHEFDSESEGQVQLQIRHMLSSHKIASSSSQLQTNRT